MFDSGPVDLPFTSIDVSGFHLPVTAGQPLAITLSRIGAGAPPWALWRTRPNNPYAGGDSFKRAGSTLSWQLFSEPYDFGFQTWVVPEPTGAAGIWALGVVALRRRRINN